MKHLRFLLTLLAALFVSSAMAADVKPVTELDAAIPLAIKLLEAKDYKAMLQTFIPPTELSKVDKKGGVDEFAKKWGSSMKSENMLKVLKAVQGTQPEMSEDGKKATYRPADGANVKGPISFIKIGEGWYIKD